MFSRVRTEFRFGDERIAGRYPVGASLYALASLSRWRVHAFVVVSELLAPRSVRSIPACRHQALLRVELVGVALGEPKAVLNLVLERLLEAARRRGRLDPY